MTHSFHLDGWIEKYIYMGNMYFLIQPMPQVSTKKGIVHISIKGITWFCNIFFPVHDRSANLSWWLPGTASYCVTSQCDLVIPLAGPLFTSSAGPKFISMSKYSSLICSSLKIFIITLQSYVMKMHLTWQSNNRHGGKSLCLYRTLSKSMQSIQRAWQVCW